MYKKYLRNISMIFLCAFATFVYFKNDDVKTVKKKANMQTVIFKDQDETLIPVSVDIGVKDNKENNIRGIEFSFSWLKTLTTLIPSTISSMKPFK